MITRPKPFLYEMAPTGRNKHMSLLAHPCHLVTPSPWPFLSSLRGFMFTTRFLQWFYGYIGGVTPAVIILILTVIRFQWWQDVSREGSHEGIHPLLVHDGLKMGILLFIISEVMFFFSLFWTYLHNSFTPDIELGELWPPVGILTVEPIMDPLLSTIILLTSGISVTWSHHAIIEGDHHNMKTGLYLTLILGACFTYVQASEYLEAGITIADAAYGAAFFITTGFHGIHVLIGTLFLLISLSRIQKGILSLEHHFGYEAAIWYWHFVDVVWMFLYILVYWWGNAY